MRRLALLSVLALASPAFADTTPKREGEYGGVTPGQKPEGKQKRPPRGTLSWIGFEPKDGGAQLFFQSVAPFQVTQRVVGSTLIATLTLTKLGTNTWRRIDTRFFDNPLAAVDAKRARKGRKIEVHIKFKNPKDAREGSLRTATEADGMFYAYLSFPAGTSTGDAPVTDEPER
jgi:hypothetical protein